MPAISRKRDLHACPKQQPKPHLKGRLSPGNWSVFAGGEKVAYRKAPCPCEVDDGIENIVAVGVDDVHIGSDDVSHQWHTTIHGGIIIDGLFTVQIHAALFDPIAAAIDRIAASPFGQTERGKLIVDKLRRMHAEGKIKINREHPLKTGVAASYDTDTEEIEVNSIESGDDVVEDLARTLVHEGTHAVIDERQKDGYLSPPLERNERESWDNENEFYKDQREQKSPAWSEELDDFDKAKDKDAWLRDLYGDEYFEH